MFETLYYLGDEMTAYADEHNQEFPLVSLPKFEVQASFVRQQTGLMMTIYSPIVYDDKRQAWERFAVEHQDWIKESREIYISGLSNKSSADNKFIDFRIPPIITELIDIEKPELGPRIAPQRERYAPIWHMSPPPIIPTTQMFNLFSADANMENIVSSMKQVGGEWA